MGGRRPQTHCHNDPSVLNYSGRRGVVCLGAEVIRAAEVAACVALDQNACTDSVDCTYTAYPAVSDDECAPTVYNGVASNTCLSPASRLCAHSGPGDPGFIGAVCNDYRLAFDCVDTNATYGGDGSFNCTDTNAYWRDDYICECAYDEASGRYEQAVVDGQCAAGGELIFTEKQTAVSNHDLSFFLKTNPKAYFLSTHLQ